MNRANGKAFVGIKGLKGSFQMSALSLGGLQPKGARVRQRLHFPPPVRNSKSMTAPPFFPDVNPLWVLSNLLFSSKNRNCMVYGVLVVQPYPRQVRNFDPLAVGIMNWPAGA